MLLNLNTLKEKCFCDNFLKENIKNRMFCELKNPKKRKLAIDKFCHDIDNIINSSTVLCKDSKLQKNDLLTEIHKISNSKIGYIISDKNDLDGMEFPLEVAIDELFKLYFGAAIIVDDHTVILKDEPSYKNSTNKYVLHVNHLH
mgnify:CR=1 FL=1